MQELRKIIKQVCTNSGRQVPWSAKFCAAVPYICGSAVWNFLHIAHLTPRILWWLLDFWKICASLAKNKLNIRCFGLDVSQRQVRIFSIWSNHAVICVYIFL